jgi:hypothetical protein
MTVEHLPEGWELEAALRDATDLGGLVRAKLSGGVLTAIDGIVSLAGSAHDERVRLLACRELLGLAQQLGAVELGPVERLWHQVMGEVAAREQGQGAAG